MSDQSTLDDPSSRPSPRRVIRSSDERVIGGVCGGLAEHTGIDPVVFRIGFVVASVFGGAGLLAYGAAWMVFPDDNGHTAFQTRRSGSSWSLGRVVVVGLALTMLPPFVVLLTLTGQLGILIPIMIFSIPLVAVVRGDGTHRSWSAGDWHSRSQTGPDRALSPRDSDVVDDTRPSHTDEGRFRRVDRDPITGLRLPVPILIPNRRGWRRRHRSRLANVTRSAGLLVAGVLLSIDLTDIADVRAVHYGAALLLVAACGLLVGAFYDDARGLISTAVVLGLFTLAANSDGFDGSFAGGFGNRTWQPFDIDDVAEPYEVGFGNGVLDLRSLVPFDGTRTIEANVGMGNLEVRLPDGIDIDVRADAGVGNVELPDEDGSSRRGPSDEGSLEIDNPGTDATLVLDLHVGVGNIEVH